MIFKQMSRYSDLEKDILELDKEQLDDLYNIIGIVDDEQLLHVVRRIMMLDIEDIQDLDEKIQALTEQH